MLNFNYLCSKGEKFFKSNKDKIKHLSLRQNEKIHLIKLYKNSPEVWKDWIIKHSVERFDIELLTTAIQYAPEHFDIYWDDKIHEYDGGLYDMFIFELLLSIKHKNILNKVYKEKIKKEFINMINFNWINIKQKLRLYRHLMTYFKENEKEWDELFLFDLKSKLGSNKDEILDKKFIFGYNKVLAHKNYDSDHFIYTEQILFRNETTKDPITSILDEYVKHVKDYDEFKKQIDSLKEDLLQFTTKKRNILLINILYINSKGEEIYKLEEINLKELKKKYKILDG